MVIDLIDPAILVSQVPIYFLAGVYYTNMNRIDAAVRAVELCPTCQRRIKEED